MGKGKMVNDNSKLSVANDQLGENNGKLGKQDKNKLDIKELKK